MIEDADAAGGDGPHRELAMTGNAEFADEEDVELGAEGPSHLERDRHASPRKPEHDDIVAIRVALELPGQLSSRVAPVQYMRSQSWHDCVRW